MYNYKKISEDFITLAKLTQVELKKHCYKQLQNYYKNNKILNDKKFLYAKGTIPLMLVAHLDTVHKWLPTNIWCSLDNTKLKADEGIGGDDRCGVYAILTILSKLDRKHLPSILFTTDEEIGGIGVSAFCKKFGNKKLGVNAFIEIDRAHRDDVVNYCDSNMDLVEKFEDLGYKYEYGSYTDIVDLMETFGISGVNLSSGYYHAHTTNEYVDFRDLMWTIENVIKFINNPNNYEKPYKYEEYKYSRKSSWYSGAWNYGDFGGWGDYSKVKNGYYDDKEYCAICQQKHNIEDMEYSEDGYICQDCYNQYKEFYVRCPECGTLLLQDENGTWCEYCGCILDGKGDDCYQYNIDDYDEDDKGE